MIKIDDDTYIGYTHCDGMAIKTTVHRSLPSRVDLLPGMYDKYIKVFGEEEYKRQVAIRKGKT